MSGRHISMGTVGLWGGTGGGTVQPIKTTADQLQVDIVVKHNINPVVLPLNLKKIQVVNLDTSIIKVSNDLQVIRVNTNEFNC